MWAALTVQSQAAHAQQAEFLERANVDFYEGPIISSSRVVGLGGAFIGIAEGAHSHLINPAAFAVRYPYSADGWFDWDFTLDWMNLAPGDGNQLDRSGRPAAYDSAQAIQFGFNIKLGRHGFGLHIRSHNYDLEDPAARLGTTRLRYEQRLGGIGYAYAFWDGDLTVGVMSNAAEVEVLDESGNAQLSLGGGAKLTFGALWAPCGAPYRIGASLRSETVGVGGGDNTQQQELEGELIPHAVTVPWELGVGASLMLGARQHNICPSFGDWEDVGGGPPPRLVVRRYILLSADLVLTGPVEDGIGLQGFLADELQRSGQTASLSARVGAESEVWANRLVIRGGSYYEPSRFADTWGRLHGTAGANLKLGELVWLWSLSTFADVADRYFNFGLGVGFWH